MKLGNYDEAGGKFGVDCHVGAARLDAGGVCGAAAAPATGPLFMVHGSGKNTACNLLKTHARLRQPALPAAAPSLLPPQLQAGFHDLILLKAEISTCVEDAVQSAALHAAGARATAPPAPFLPQDQLLEGGRKRQIAGHSGCVLAPGHQATARLKTTTVNKQREGGN